MVIIFYTDIFQYFFFFFENRLYSIIIVIFVQGSMSMTEKKDHRLNARHFSTHKTSNIVLMIYFDLLLFFFSRYRKYFSLLRIVVCSKCIRFLVNVSGRHMQKHILTSLDSSDNNNNNNRYDCCVVLALSIKHWNVYRRRMMIRPCSWRPFKRVLYYHTQRCRRAVCRVSRCGEFYLNRGQITM